MNDDDLKKFGTLIDQKLKGFGEVVDEKVNKALEPVKDRLSNMEGSLNNPNTGLKRINEKLDALWDQTVRLTEDVVGVKDAFKSQTAALNQTNTNVTKVDKRLNEVESHLGIVSPPELTIVE